MKRKEKILSYAEMSKKEQRLCLAGILLIAFGFVLFGVVLFCLPFIAIIKAFGFNWDARNWEIQAEPLYGLSADSEGLALVREDCEISVRRPGLEGNGYAMHYCAVSETAVLKNTAPSASTARIYFPFQNLKRRYFGMGNDSPTRAPEAVWNGQKLAGTTVFLPDFTELSGCTLSEAGLLSEEFSLTEENTDKAFAVYKIPLAAGEAGMFRVQTDVLTSVEAYEVDVLRYRSGTGFTSAPAEQDRTFRDGSGRRPSDGDAAAPGKNVVRARVGFLGGGTKRMV